MGDRGDDRTLSSDEVGQAAIGIAGEPGQADDRNDGNLTGQPFDSPDCVPTHRVVGRQKQRRLKRNEEGRGWYRDLAAEEPGPGQEGNDCEGQVGVMQRRAMPQGPRSYIGDPEDDDTHGSEPHGPWYDNTLGRRRIHQRR